MNKYPYAFIQLVQYLDKNRFNYLIHKYEGDIYATIVTTIWAYCLRWCSGRFPTAKAFWTSSWHWKLVPGNSIITAQQCDVYTLTEFYLPSITIRYAIITSFYKKGKSLLYIRNKNCFWQNSYTSFCGRCLVYRLSTMTPFLVMLLSTIAVIIFWGTSS